MIPHMSKVIPYCLEGKSLYSEEKILFVKKQLTYNCCLQYKRSQIIISVQQIICPANKIQVLKYVEAVASYIGHLLIFMQ